MNLDFSVLYVALNAANSALPMVSGSRPCGAREGSLLLWILLLSVWTASTGLAALSEL